MLLTLPGTTSQEPACTSAVLVLDSTDRGALLGLATLARLTYDYPTAERLYGSLVAAARPDRYAAFARLGQLIVLRSLSATPE
jgi:hypothetical protein